jgi:hypothetical protein
MSFSSGRLTQETPWAVPGRRYGTFAEKPLVKRGAGVLCVHECATYELLIKEKRLTKVILTPQRCED